MRPYSFFKTLCWSSAVYCSIALGHPVEEVVGVWTSPPEQVPSKGVPDGPLIGNGQLGGVFAWHWSPRLNVDLYLGHNAFFAAPSGGASSCGYSPGGRKAVAGLTLVFPSATPGGNVLAEQFVVNGTVRLSVSGRSDFTLSAFIHATEDVLLLDLQGVEEVEVTMWTFSGCHGPPRPPVSPSTPVPEGAAAPVSKTTGPTSDRLPSQVVAGTSELQVMRGNGWPFQAASFPVRWFGLSAKLGADVENGRFTEVEAMGRCGEDVFLRGPCARGTWHPGSKGSTLTLQLNTWALLEKHEFSELKPLTELRVTHANEWIRYWER